MYFNNVHILYYVLAGIVGMIVGQLIDWANKRLPEYKKVFSKEIIQEYKKSFKPNYSLMLIMVVAYIGLLYKFGISKTLLENVDLLKFLILAPMLLIAFMIDYRLKIIPNRLNLSLFEVGLIFAFIHGISNINVAIDMFLGMLVGGGIFLLITLIGGLIAGREAMGFGDVKLMGALRTVFWHVPDYSNSSSLFLYRGSFNYFLCINEKNRKWGNSICPSNYYS